MIIIITIHERRNGRGVCNDWGKENAVRVWWKTFRERPFGKKGVDGRFI